MPRPVSDPLVQTLLDRAAKDSPTKKPRKESIADYLRKPPGPLEAETMMGNRNPELFKRNGKQNR